MWSSRSSNRTAGRCLPCVDESKEEPSSIATEFGPSPQYEDEQHCVPQSEKATRLSQPNSSPGGANKTRITRCKYKKGLPPRGAARRISFPELQNYVLPVLPTVGMIRADSCLSKSGPQSHLPSRE
jgi:hypothetical protein